MSLTTVTFTKTDGSYEVPVTTTGSLTTDQLLSFKPFMQWVANMSPTIHVEDVAVTDVHWFGPRIGFMTIKSTARLMGVGAPIPGIAFLRGGSVAVLVVLRCEGRKYVLIVRQPRVPVGQAALAEIPAGMLDGDGNFVGVAAKEMQEEAHISFAPSELVRMSVDHKQYPSPGGCDEFIEYFYASAAVTPAFLRSLEGRATGCAAEGERISLTCIPYEDLWCSLGDAKAAVACHLFENLVRVGRMNDTVTTARVFRGPSELDSVVTGLKEE